MGNGKAAAEERHVTDDLGSPLLLAGRPRRIVSLVPSLTESIAATVPDVLVGATQWCTHPPGLDVVRVRGTKNPDLAALGALAPDLVVANQEENRKLDVDRLRAAGIPVWVTRIDSLAEAFDSMGRLFGEALGLKGVPGWLTEAETVWNEPPARPGLRVAVPVWRDPWTWVGSGTYSDDLIAKLGWRNVVADLDSRYPRLPVAQVLAQRPDVVLLPDEPYAFGEHDGPEAFDGIDTVLVPGRPLFWYGPAMIEARRTLEALVRRL